MTNARNNCSLIFFSAIRRLATAQNPKTPTPSKTTTTNSTAKAKKGGAELSRAASKFVSQAEASSSSTSAPRRWYAYLFHKSVGSAPLLSDWFIDTHVYMTKGFDVR